MKHFTFQEFEDSDKARELGIDNRMPELAEAHIVELVDILLDPLREAWGGPLTVTSGYRCPELNRAVGGSETSAHLAGWAADLVPDVDDPRGVQGLVRFAIEWLTATGLRTKIFNAIPDAVRIAIPAGIGLFIAFLGLQNAGIVVDSSTLVGLASFNLYSGNATWGTIMPMLVTIFAVLAIAILTKRGVKGAVLWGILGGAVAYYVLGFTVPGFYEGFLAGMSFNPFTAFQEFAELSLFKVFTEGFDFSAYIAANGTGGFIVMFLTTALAFCMVDMFDTLGTLYGACARGNLLTKQGDVPNMDKAMLADAVATACGAICGTSTVTTFVESSAGIGEGGRTGLASMFTALFFFIAMFLAPLAQLIPTYATAAALIYVGVLMMNCVRDIEWTTPEIAVPAFLTIAMMSFTYSISFGIAFGIISWTIIALFTGKAREIKAATWAIGILFALTFFLTH